MGQDKQNHKQVEFERFCLVLSQIPEGKVCSYGRLASLVGLVSARQSAALLRKLPVETQLPWYRVVSASGKLSRFSGSLEQRRLLEAEGLIFSDTGRFSKQYYI